jgi:hypothetical protein
MRQLGVPVVDADIISHKVMEKDKPAHRRVVAAFKAYPGVVTPDGDIDRAALRQLVFSDRFLPSPCLRLNNPPPPPRFGCLLAQARRTSFMCRSAVSASCVPML